MDGVEGFSGAAWDEHGTHFRLLLASMGRQEPSLKFMQVNMGTSVHQAGYRRPCILVLMMYGDGCLGIRRA